MQDYMMHELCVSAHYQSLFRTMRDGSTVSLQQAHNLNRLLNASLGSGKKFSIENERNVIESVCSWLNFKLPNKLFENHPQQGAKNLVLQRREDTDLNVAASLISFACYAYQLSTDRSQNKSIVKTILKPVLISYALAAAKHGFKDEAIRALEQHNHLTAQEEEVQGSISLRDISFTRKP